MYGYLGNPNLTEPGRFEPIKSEKRNQGKRKGLISWGVMHTVLLLVFMLDEFTVWNITLYPIFSFPHT